MYSKQKLNKYPLPYAYITFPSIQIHFLSSLELKTERLIMLATGTFWSSPQNQNWDSLVSVLVKCTGSIILNSSPVFKVLCCWWQVYLLQLRWFRFANGTHNRWNSNWKRQILTFWFWTGPCACTSETKAIKIFYIYLKIKTKQKKNPPSLSRF